MKVKLVSYTTPVNSMQLQGVATPTDLMAYCARVSNPSNQTNSETAEKLLKYLIRHKHWSPLEMVDATFEVETTRDISRQMIRHRSFSFQEFSQRYAEALGFEWAECRLQDHKNRQNSIPCTDEKLNKDWMESQWRVWDYCKKEYEWALSQGIAKEQARKLLPEGLTLSRLYMKGSLRSWIHYVELRSANGTQKEHIDIAVEIGKAISELFPVSWNALTKE